MVLRVHDTGTLDMLYLDESVVSVLLMSLIGRMIIHEGSSHPLQTRYIHPMLFQCWASVEDGGATLKQHWVNVPC